MATVTQPRTSRGRAFALLAALCAGFAGGCAALTNPVADGIPVRRLPPEVLAVESRTAMVPIDLTLLRLKQPEKHVIESGDILGIFIESVVGEKNQLPPVRISDVPGVPPAIGYPFVVAEDGRVTLPFIDPVDVKGLSVPGALEKIRKIYLDQEILKKGSERVFVTLIQPREYKVTVFREDGGVTGQANATIFGNYGSVLGTQKRSSAYDLRLPAYQNDVLTALSRSGGLPGSDVKEEIIVYRKNRLDTEGKPLVQRIPLRVMPDYVPNLKTEDITLDNGDTIFLEAREAEVFYTGGLIGAGQYQLPRDYDLDIVQALIQVRAPIINGGFNQNFFTASSTNSGIGSPSPSLVSIIRKTSNNQQLNIRVDLNKAFHDPRERIVVKAGDMIIMQEKPGEAIARYFSQTFRFNFLGTFIRQSDLTGTATLFGP